jgi:hypothetical protein
MSQYFILRKVYKSIAMGRFFGTLQATFEDNEKCSATEILDNRRGGGGSTSRALRLILWNRRHVINITFDLKFLWFI